jgi:hypothetical protein
VSKVADNQLKTKQSKFETFQEEISRAQKTKYGQTDGHWVVSTEQNVLGIRDMNAGPGFVKFKEEMIDDWRGRDYPKVMEIIIEEEPELALAEAEGPIVAQEDVAEFDFDDADARLKKSGV